MLATLALLALVAATAQATHAICDWRPFPGHPADYAFRHQCEGGLKKDDDTHGHYFCGPNDEIMIADFGYLKPNTLEWASPCGSDGYALNLRGQCPFWWWALCLGPSCDGNCFYMWNSDDCEWPTPFNQSQLPATITLWSY